MHIAFYFVCIKRSGIFNHNRRPGCKIRYLNKYDNLQQGCQFVKISQNQLLNMGFEGIKSLP